ncbi:MAG: flagellar type III secretion system protein FliR [Rhodospirillum sp.]|nr:flagellar type III secretion system protein FliR [Rhodospirillum sp.]MCF8488880.1 flagellar type III secretion system protein FliR [Rhodospirillum sp.]
MFDAYLNLNVFHLLLVFVRMGAAIMILPGFGTSYIPTQVRLLLAVTISMVVLPTVGGTLPPVPDSATLLVLLITAEAMIGFFLGIFGQFLLVPINLAGTVMGFSTGLMMAQAFDPASNQQGSLISGFLSEVAIVLLFALGLHHLMLEAVVGSYQVFPPGKLPDTGDISQLLSHLLTDGFRLGWQLASPFVVYGVIFQSTLGVLARLMPQLNILFVAMPGQIIFGLALLMSTTPVILMAFMGYFEDNFIGLVR